MNSNEYAIIQEQISQIMDLFKSLTPVLQEHGNNINTLQQKDYEIISSMETLRTMIDNNTEAIKELSKLI